MCGLAGIFAFSGDVDPGILKQSTTRMLDRVAYRGPDGRGVWSSPQSDVCFAHARLEVFGPGPAGSQPMSSACGRYTIILNGAIYNYRKLGASLRNEGVAFRGASDTEVLVELIARRGLQAALDSITGMYAFALYDGLDRRVSLVRDRLGQKPMFYCTEGGVLSFGSELSVFPTALGGTPQLNIQAAQQFLQYGFVAGPDTLVEGVRQLQPGTVLQLRAGDTAPTCARYWSLPTERQNQDQAGIPDRIESLLRDAVQGQLQADVPAGIFLSGGVDSALVASMAAELTDAPVPAFILGFADSRYDESALALKTAEAIGLVPRVLQVSAEDLAEEAWCVIRDAAEPVADPSLIPTRMLARRASDEVTVVLGGDGADELFGGYDRYRVAARLGQLPNWISSGLDWTLERTPDGFMDFTGALLAGRDSGLGTEHLSRRAAKLQAALAASRKGDYWPLRSALLARAELWSTQSVRLPGETPQAMQTPAESVSDSVQSRLMRDDIADWLPDSVLTKVDRATMRYGIEARAPFLDHRLAQWAATLPIESCASPSESKRCLRDLARRRIGAQVADAPKRGFSPPMLGWVNDASRELAGDLLHDAACRALPDSVRQHVDDQLKLIRDEATSLSAVTAQTTFSALGFASWWARVGAAARSIAS